jgi:hypothetical protein
MTYELSRNHELQKLNTFADNYCSRGSEQVSCVYVQRTIGTAAEAEASFNDGSSPTSSRAQQYLYEPFSAATRIQ